MPIFERPPIESLTLARDRWTPLYMEHGRLEVDDSSVKWIGADRTVMRIPIATVSTIMLGPGTTITHAAIKACSDCNTPVCWVGEDGMRFYAFGSSPTHDNARARKQADIYASRSKRTAVARSMFSRRFPDIDVSKSSVQELRGMEGIRVRNMYSELGQQYGVTWKGRNYNPNNWHIADNINRAISAANSSLYALCTAIIYSMGYMPQLGFVHVGGTLPFVFDIADMYKPETTLLAAFQTLGANPKATEKEVLVALKKRIESFKLLDRIPKDIEELLG
jgi:CRISP-associated protein Cas1